MASPSVLVLGSSHVNRLSSFINSSPKLHNFDQHRCNIVFTGISGGKILNDNHLRVFENAIRAHRPAWIIIHIGGNDLDRKDISVEDVHLLILKYINLLRTFCRRYSVKFVVCQLLFRERTRNLLPDCYNQMVLEANKSLKSECKHYDDIVYWKLRGLKNSVENIFSDGVHLNRQIGLPKYYRCIRGAILYLSRHVHACR